MSSKSGHIRHGECDRGFHKKISQLSDYMAHAILLVYSFFISQNCKAFEKAVRGMENKKQALFLNRHVSDFVTFLRNVGGGNQEMFSCVVDFGLHQWLRWRPLIYLRELCEAAALPVLETASAVLCTLGKWFLYVQRGYLWI